MPYEVSLLLQGVDSIYHAVILLYVEVVRVLFIVYLLPGSDVRMGIDLEQTFLQGFHFHSAHRLGGGHVLPVDISDAYKVGVHDGEVAYATAHQTLCTPGPYSSHAEYDDASLHEVMHESFSEQKFVAVVYSFLYSFHSVELFTGWRSQSSCTRSSPRVSRAIPVRPGIY